MADPIVVEFAYRSATDELMREMMRLGEEKGAALTPTGPLSGEILVKKLWVTLLRGTYRFVPAHGAGDGGKVIVELTEVPPIMPREEIVRETRDKLHKLDAGTYAQRREQQQAEAGSA